MVDPLEKKLDTWCHIGSQEGSVPVFLRPLLFIVILQVGCNLPQWGWGTLIFSYIHRLGSFIWGSKFSVWGFLKNECFLGYEDFVDIFFVGHHKIGLYLGVISMHIRVFS